MLKLNALQEVFIYFNIRVRKFKIPCMQNPINAKK